MKKRTFLTACLILPALWLATPTLAQNDDPKHQLQTQIDTLIERFTAERAELEQDSSKLYALAEEMTTTGWAFDKMAQLVLGKNWKTISDAQKTEFTTEFKQLLIRTYASAMFKYTGKESIHFGDTTFKGNKNNRATVLAEGDLGTGAPRVPLSFSYFKDKADNWNIYNIDIDGVSLVTVYRVSYNNIIASKGIDSLIADIRAKNQQAGGASS